MILADPSTMKLGDKVFQLLLDNFQLYNLSVTSMTRCIQYALMDHYYGNPLSILTGGVSGGGEELDGDLNNVSTAGMIGMLSEEERDEIADNIRMLPSFKR